MTPRERAELALTAASTAGPVRLPDRTLWVRSVADAIEAAVTEERERLHTLLEACHAAIDPEGHEELVARLLAELDGSGCACASLRERAAAEEREACALIAEEDQSYEFVTEYGIGKQIAAAIRARGKAEEVKP